jgi:hypothetical protein
MLRLDLRGRLRGWHLRYCCFEVTASPVELRAPRGHEKNRLAAAAAALACSSNTRLPFFTLFPFLPYLWLPAAATRISNSVEDAGRIININPEMSLNGAAYFVCRWLNVQALYIATQCVMRDWLFSEVSTETELLIVVLATGSRMICISRTNSHISPVTMFKYCTNETKVHRYNYRNFEYYPSFCLLFKNRTSRRENDG